ncbi:hypothetical protein GIW06_15345 [Pseudomonas syringae]|nr:hypothetical protein [Pseudomonas syringae]
MTLIYGHRGAKGEAPENTLTSFQECLKHGVRRCELDLHLSKDGELMVIHDPTLKRTTDRRGKVNEHLAADLVTYDARKGGPGWVSPCPIPRLEELFEQCAFEHWQLEVKSASRTRAANTVLAIREMAQRHGLLAKVPYEVGKAFFKGMARAQISGERVGMLKILFHRETLEVLGVHCFGDQASEIVHIGQAIMSQPGEANTMKYFVNTTFNYPTMAEAYRVAAYDGLNRLF